MSGPQDLPLFLRAPRAGGLWLIGVLIPLATIAGFILSYRGLYDWAVHHGWPWYLAPLFPLLIDLLIIAGEVVLFVAAIDGGTPRRVRAAAWGITVGFTGLSIAGNVSHAVTADVATRVGWGLPPAVLAVALGFGLGELKRQAGKYRQEPPAVTAGVTVKPAAGYRPPAVREIMARQGCSPATAKKIRSEVSAAVRAASNGHGELSGSA